MAVEIHYAEIGLVNINTATGQPYRRGGSGSLGDLTIKESMNFSTEHRIIPDSDIPNTAGYPDIKTYLNREGLDDFEVVQIAQYFVVTQKVSSGSV